MITMELVSTNVFTDNFLRSHICKIQAHAQFLRGLIGQLKVPSFEEYEAAEKAVHEEYDRQWAAEDPHGYAAERAAAGRRFVKEDELLQSLGRRKPE
jgi:hypothetical protein